MLEPPKKAVIRGPRKGDFGLVMHYHATLYAVEYQWDGSFENDVAELLVQFAREGDPNRKRAWVADQDGKFAGSVFLMEEKPRVARLRMLLVQPWARGQGLGRRLVEHCIEFSRECGYDRLMLSTLDILVNARKLYQSMGFILDESQKACLWGRDMILEYWSLPLRDLPPK